MYLSNCRCTPAISTAPPSIRSSYLCQLFVYRRYVRLVLHTCTIPFKKKRYHVLQAVETVAVELATLPLPRSSIVEFVRVSYGHKCAIASVGCAPPFPTMHGVTFEEV